MNNDMAINDNLMVDEQWQPLNTTIKDSLTADEQWQLLMNLSYENVQKLVVTFVYIGLLVVFGIPGNSLVILVYTLRIKTGTVRIFILAMAVVDLFNNIFLVPFEIFELTNSFTFTSNTICRIMLSLGFMTVYTSLYTLIAIAIDRYRRVCKPYAKQISPKYAKVMVGIAVFAACIITIPAITVNGIKEFQFDYHGLNLTGYECSFAGKEDSWHADVLVAVQFLQFVSALFLLIILYILVGRKIFVHSRFSFKKRSSRKRSRGTETETEDTTQTKNTTVESSSGSEKGGLGSTEIRADTPADQIPRTNDNDRSECRQGSIEIRPDDSVDQSPRTTGNDRNESEQDSKEIRPDNSVDQSPRTTEKDRSESGQSNNSVDQSPGTTEYIRSESRTGSGEIRSDTTVEPTPGKSDVQKQEQKPKSTTRYPATAIIVDNEERKREKAQNIKNRTTMMFVALTVVFIVSCVPFLVISAMRSLDPDFVTSMNDLEFQVYNIFLRSYSINAVANPFVYSFCNVRFRQEAWRLITCRKN